MSDKKFKNAFHTAKDNRLFWVVGYFTMSNVVEFTEELLNLVKAFSERFSIPLNEVGHMEVLESRRYKNMLVLYIKTKPANMEGVFEVTDERAMMDWLTD